MKLKKTRTTVNLADAVMQKGFERMVTRRCSSFSNYVEKLIAEDAGLDGSNGSEKELARA